MRSFATPKSTKSPENNTCVRVPLIIKPCISVLQCFGPICSYAGGLSWKYPHITQIQNFSDGPVMSICLWQSWPNNKVRVWNVVNSVADEDNYLAHKYLNLGLPPHAEGKGYPWHEYSVVFIQGTGLSKSLTKKLYHKKMMVIRKDKTYMEIWRIHTLDSVLGIQRI